MCFFRITWASFLFFDIDRMLFFNIDLMMKMQLLGTPPNSNRCTTGGAPNRASSLFDDLLFAAFGDRLRSFWSSSVGIENPYQNSMFFKTPS